MMTRSALPTVEAAVAVVVREGRVLLARREAGAHLGGLWEFPGGKVEAGEEPAAAALRELREETGLAGSEAEPLVVVVHDYPDRTVRLHAFLVRQADGTISVSGGREWAWVGLDEIEAREMPDANATILRALRWRAP